MVTWIKKQDLVICCLLEGHFGFRNTHRLRVNGWKKIFRANGNQKNQGWLYLHQIKQTLKMVKREKDVI